MQIAKAAIEIIDRIIEKTFPALGSFVDASAIRSIRTPIFNVKSQSKYITIASERGISVKDDVHWRSFHMSNNYSSPDMLSCYPISTFGYLPGRFIV